MSSNDEDAIGTFMSITGASEADAVHKLEEHHGNLNAAINAYFNDNDRNRNQETSTDPVVDDAMDINSPIPPNWPPSSTSPFDGAHAIVDVSESAREHDDDDNVRNMSSAPFTHTGEHGSLSTGPSAPAIIDVPDYNNDIEEEMVQAAIEASKRDAAVSSQQYDDLDLGDPNARSVQSHHEYPELDHAVPLSLKSGDQEKELRELEGKVGDSETETHELATSEEMGRMTSSNIRFPLLDVSSSSVQHEAEELPQVRNQRRQLSSNPTEDPDEFDVSPPSSPRQHDNDHPIIHHQGSEFPSEWGGISSEEHDEAVMLEAAMFGGIPEGSGYHFPYATHRSVQNGYYPRHDPRPPSPSLTAQRLLREQQDDEYLAALQADREKELKAMEEAEDALAEERRKEEELRRREQEEQEIERQLAAKEASLPPEPSKDDENVVTLLVRMPDGSRRGRRFLKSDQLQHIFDFIDVGRGVKPGSYRLVRPYPRRAFSEEERTSVLNELGLTSKQEALYLELI